MLRALLISSLTWGGLPKVFPQNGTCPDKLIGIQTNSIHVGQKGSFFVLDSSFSYFKWKFEGGRPATSTLAKPSVYYDYPGIYPIELFVDSCRYLVKKGIEVDFRKDACTFYAKGKFSGDREQGIVIGVGDSLVLEPEYLDRDSSEIEWIIEGQDKLFQTSFRPHISYEEPGAYDVAMTLSRKGVSCRAWKKDFIRVLQRLRAKFRFHVELRPNGVAQVYFIDTSKGGPSSWKWEVSFSFEGVVHQPLFSREESYNSSYPIQELIPPIDAVYLHIKAKMRISRGDLGDEFSFEKKVDLYR